MYPSRVMARIFTYYDNSLPLHGKIGASPVLIEVEAESITEADKVVLEMTGVNVNKATHIGCTIAREFTFTPPTDAGIRRQELQDYYSALES